MVELVVRCAVCNASLTILESEDSNYVKQEKSQWENGHESI